MSEGIKEHKSGLAETQKVIIILIRHYKNAKNYRSKWFRPNGDLIRRILRCASRYVRTYRWTNDDGSRCDTRESIKAEIINKEINRDRGGRI